MIRNLLWQLRIRNRFALAWWAFRNPDNLTMLRHDMDTYQQQLADNDVERFSHDHVQATVSWWLTRYFDLPVR